MTGRQKEYIEFIEEFSSVRFTGNPNSNADISKYIKANKEIAHLNAMSPWQRQYI